MKARKLMKLLETLVKDNPEAEIKMHHREGNNLLFAVTYVNDNSVMVLEDRDDNDLGSELGARFEALDEKEFEEEYFYRDLIDTGFTLEDIKENIPDRYEEIRGKLKEYGLM